MAIYTKKQLADQTEIIMVIRALTALTTFRLNKTYQIIKETKQVIQRVAESISRVFEFYPLAGDAKSAKGGTMVLTKKVLTVPRRLLVFISANKDLYGELIKKIGRVFLDDLKRTHSDAIVIGKLGKILVEREKISSKVFYFDLDDDRPDITVLNKIVELVTTYDSVVVYHGLAESLLSQIATKSEIKKIFADFVVPQKTYFFEPSPQEVLEFLQNQVSINSFEQKIYEAQYARLSARRWNWTKQQLNRQKLLDQLTREFLQYKKGIASKQQQVAVFARRLNIDQDEILKGSSFYSLK